MSTGNVWMMTEEQGRAVLDQLADLAQRLAVLEGAAAERTKLERAYWFDANPSGAPDQAAE